MTKDGLIHTAVEGGWKYMGQTPKQDEYGRWYITTDNGGILLPEHIEVFLLDITFWQAVHKQLKREHPVCNGLWCADEYCNASFEQEIGDWKRLMLDTIQRIMNGLSIDEAIEKIDWWNYYDIND